MGLFLVIFFFFFLQFTIEKLVQTITFCLTQTYLNIDQRKELSH